MTAPHPDLLPFVRGGILRHPLVVRAPRIRWAEANLTYETKRMRLAEVEEKVDWHTAIWLHERP
jgi:hypothetical protein